MKFKVAVIGILLAVLAVGTATGVMLIQEAQKQTKIALINAQASIYQIENEQYRTEGGERNRIFPGYYKTQLEEIEKTSPRQ